ncbi:nuclear transport factor 2 family protein [Bradyrhizobium sp. B120]|uniref:nuclear transport factor 2 family protein n=1 Tax=Bradyrhizobium sp. B120 TaxID=3410088 RepID=UPI003B981E53
MTQTQTLKNPIKDRSSDIREIYEHYVATFATRDIAAIAENHATDGTFWLHTGTKAVQGREAIGTTFAGFFEQWPNFGFTVHRTLFTERQWVLDWTATAELRGADGLLKPVSFDCLDVVDVDAQGLVIRKDTFIDLVQVQKARSLGA